MRHRLAILAAAVALVLAMVPGVALAAPGEVHFITVSGPDGPESWKVTYVLSGPNEGASVVTDPACGTAEQDFRAVFYDHGSYNGDRVVLCRSESDFCTIPGHGYPLYIGCDFPFTFNHANDEFLSVSVGDIKTDGGCLRYFEDAGYDGGSTRLREFTLYPSIAIGGDGSSVKRLFAGNC